MLPSWTKLVRNGVKAWKQSVRRTLFWTLEPYQPCTVASITSHVRVHALYTTLLLRGLCVTGNIRKTKEVRRFISLLLTLSSGCIAAGFAQSLEIRDHFWLGLCLAHGSAPCSLGKGGFLGALAMLEGCDCGARGAGAAFTGRPVSVADAEAGGG